MLVVGSILGCAGPLCVLAASLVLRDPFAAPFNAKKKADTSRTRFAQGGAADSDHLALLAAFAGWRGAENKYLYCKDKYLSPSTMGQISELADQLWHTLGNVGLNVEGAAWESNKLMLRSCLTAGLLPNVAETEYVREHTRTNKSGVDKFKWRVGYMAQGDRVMPHPQSVIFYTVVGDAKGEWEERQKVPIPETHKCMIVYDAKTQSSQANNRTLGLKWNPTFIKRCTVIPPVAIFLFGNPVVYRVASTGEQQTSAQVQGTQLAHVPGTMYHIEVGDASTRDHIARLTADAETTKVLAGLRDSFLQRLEWWLSGAPKTAADEELITCVCHLLCQQ